MADVKCKCGEFIFSDVWHRVFDSPSTSTHAGPADYCHRCGAPRPEPAPEMTDRQRAALALINAHRKYLGKLALPSWSDALRESYDANYWLAVSDAAHELFAAPRDERIEELTKEVDDLRAVIRANEGREGSTVVALREEVRKMTATVRDREDLLNKAEYMMTGFDALRAIVHKHGGVPGGTIVGEAGIIIEKQAKEIEDLASKLKASEEQLHAVEVLLEQERKARVHWYQDRDKRIAELEAQLAEVKKPAQPPGWRVVAPNERFHCTQSLGYYDSPVYRMPKACEKRPAVITDGCRALCAEHAAKEGVTAINDEPAKPEPPKPTVGSRERPAPISKEAREARRPKPVEEFVGALQDSVHKEPGHTWSARSQKWFDAVALKMFNSFNRAVGLREHESLEDVAASCCDLSVSKKQAHEVARILDEETADLRARLDRAEKRVELTKDWVPLLTVEESYELFRRWLATTSNPGEYAEKQMARMVKEAQQNKAEQLLMEAGLS